MQRYAIKLTIGGMTGAFAEKYARFVRDAQFLDAYLQESTARAAAGPITVMAPHAEPTPFDGFALLPRLMQQLRKVSLEDAERPFFTGARLEPDDGSEPGPWLASLEASDDKGPFTLHALGRRATIVRAAEAPPEVLSTAQADAGSNLVRSVTGGVIRIRFASRRALFRDDLEALVNLCEEVLAKDQPLIASPIPIEDLPAETSGAGLPRYDEL